MGIETAEGEGEEEGSCPAWAVCSGIPRSGKLAMGGFGFHRVDKVTGRGPLYAVKIQGFKRSFVRSTLYVFCVGWLWLPWD